MGGLQVAPDEADPEGNYGFSDTSTFSALQGNYAVEMGGRLVVASGTQVTCYNEFTGEKIWSTTINNSLSGNLAIRSANPPQVQVCSSNGMVTEINLETGKVTLERKFPHEVIMMYDGDVICRSSPPNLGMGLNRTSYMYRYTWEATPKLVWGPVQGGYRITAINDGVLLTGIITENYMNGIDVESGTILWTRETIGMSVGACGYGKYFTGGVDQSFYAFDLHTGNIAWKTDVPGASFWSENYVMIGDGYVVDGNYDGKFHCFNATTGQQIWEYYTGNCPYEIYKTWFGTWMVGGGAAPVGADGKVYGATGEHSSYETAQIPGQYLYGLSLNTGDLLWKYPVRLGGHSGRPIIADGILFTTDAYTNQLYAFSKGPTALEVSVTATQIAKGEFTAITGRITDQSPAQPGTPAVSKDSMDSWMAYLHGGFAKPAEEDITGVPVTLKAISSNGEVTNIGTTLSDANGYFAYKWTPPAKDEIYTIIATFDGDESYYSSQAETHLTVDQPAGVIITANQQGAALFVSGPQNASTVILLIAVVFVVAGCVVILRKRTKTYSGQSVKNLISKRTSMLLIALITGALVFASLPYTITPAVAQTNSDYPMWGYDAAHTGFSQSTAPSQFKIGWTYKTGGPIMSSAAVVDGKLYIGSEDMYVYCLDANNGALVWRYLTGGGVTSSPAVVGGKLYVGSFDNYVYCLDPNNGDLIWRFKTDKFVYSSPTVTNGKVYINSADKNTYCLDANNGSLIWEFTNKGISNPSYDVIQGDTYAYYYSSPAVVGDKVYIGSFDWYCYCLDANNGSKIWETKMPGSIFDSSPTVADGRLFIGTDDYNYYCLNASTGSFLWNTSAYVKQYIGSGAFWIQSTPAYAYGKVYMSFYHKCAAFDPASGSLLWQGTLGTMQKASVTVADGKVLTANHDRYLYMFNAQTGDRIQGIQLANGFDSTPIVAGGNIYVGNLDGKVYCLVSGTAQTLGSMNLNVNIQPKTVSLGSNANIQGYIMSYSGEWPVGASVTINCTKPDGTNLTATATTGDLGDFVCAFMPEVLGTYTVQASWSGNEMVSGSVSNPQTFYVVEPTPNPITTPPPDQTLSPTTTPTPTQVPTTNPTESPSQIQSTQPPTQTSTTTQSPSSTQQQSETSSNMPIETVYAVIVAVVVIVVVIVAVLMFRKRK
jgi:outer membrane protein assembly factor BamB